ncbi:MAG: c-type cytochrome, partial [Pirellulaceae bacterium]|nr:c-type cytochrome [Pirellulaceae bacterium]
RLLGQAHLLAADAAASQQDAQRLLELLGPRHPPELRGEAVDALERIGRDELPGQLLAGWEAHLPDLRRQVLDVLLRRENWTRELLAALRDGRLQAAQIDPRRRQQLLEHRLEFVRRQAAELLASTLPSGRREVLAAYQDSLQRPGDAARGRELFAKKCAACHRLEGVGHAVGPDLTALTDKSPAAMLVAILDPNRAIEDRFLDYQVVTADGRVWSGMLAGETGNAITLQTQDGKQQPILRGQIELLRTTGKSFMPEGIERELSADDVAAVIAYVRGVKESPKQFEGNAPQVAPVRDDGSIRLLAIHARIYGPTLVFESQYRNLGYWQSATDRAEWTLQVPRAGRYAVSLDYACADDVAGNRVRLDVLDQSLSVQVPGTGGWDRYGSLSLGTLQLPAGPVDAILRSDGPVRGAVLDLRGVRLVPQP